MLVGLNRVHLCRFLHLNFKIHVEFLSCPLHFIRVEAIWINYNGQPHRVLLLLKEFKHC